jgi:hypothetical protein
MQLGGRARPTGARSRVPSQHKTTKTLQLRNPKSPGQEAAKSQFGRTAGCFRCSDDREGETEAEGGAEVAWVLQWLVAALS